MKILALIAALLGALALLAAGCGGYGGGSKHGGTSTSSGY